MKPDKAKIDEELKKILDERNQNFFICEQCGQVYEDPSKLPVRCLKCGACLLCNN
jgi:rubrerythrin